MGSDSSLVCALMMSAITKDPPIYKKPSRVIKAAGRSPLREILDHHRWSAGAFPTTAKSDRPDKHRGRNLRGFRSTLLLFSNIWLKNLSKSLVVGVSRRSRATSARSRSPQIGPSRFVYATYPANCSFFIHRMCGLRSAVDLLPRYADLNTVAAVFVTIRVGNLLTSAGSLPLLLDIALWCSLYGYIVLSFFASLQGTGTALPGARPSPTASKFQWRLHSSDRFADDAIAMALEWNYWITLHAHLLRSSSRLSVSVLYRRPC
jgi:hypothetical protein